MSTREEEAMRDPLGAGIYQAIACRFFHNYAVIRDYAARRGDVGDLPSALDHAALRQRYDRLIEEHLLERPDTATSVRAFIDFAACVLFDLKLNEILIESSIVGSERDLEEVLTAIQRIGDWVNKKELAEFAAKLRSAAPAT